MYNSTSWKKEKKKKKYKKEVICVHTYTIYTNSILYSGRGIEMCTQGGAYSNFHVFGFTATKTNPELHAVMVINGYTAVIICDMYTTGGLCMFKWEYVNNQTYEYTYFSPYLKKAKATKIKKKKRKPNPFYIFEML